MVKHLVLYALLASGLAASSRADLIAVARDNRTYLVDAQTAQATLIGPTGRLFAEGLAPKWSTGRIFVTNVFLEPSTDAFGLGEVHRGTGAISQIGDGDYGGYYLPGIAFAGNGDLLGLGNGNQLFRIDEGTGDLTLLVDVTGTPNLIVGFASTPAGTLYAIDRTTVFGVDEATGVLTPIGPHGMAPIGFTLPLAFDPVTGLLYSADSSNGRLFRIDPATGAATLIGNTGIQPAGLAVGGGVIEVPALGATGVALLVLALASAALLLLRARPAAGCGAGRSRSR